MKIVVALGGNALLRRGEPLTEAVQRHTGPDAELGNNVFAAGSMAPKVEAGLRFAIASGKGARIGRIEDALSIVAGKAGTILMAEHKGTEFRT